MEPFVILLVTILLILVHTLFMKKPRTTKKIIDIAFIYSMVVMVGLGGIIAFIGHVFFGPNIAAMIGWMPGSPFQYEVGVADLALGVTAILVPWIRGTYWISAALANAIFLIGCAVGHIKDLMLAGNTAAYNAGPVLYINDIAVPLIILILAVASIKVIVKKAAPKKKPAKRSKGKKK
jgi:hypothetical protein